MKKSKLIVPALAMLVMSTAATVTGTVAWFSMNTKVTAGGMQVKAQAESGIVISNKQYGGEWLASADTTTPAAELLPTSTVAAVEWYHSSSTDASKAHEGNIGYAYVVQGTGLYSLTTDTTFADGKAYYTKDGSSFTIANSVTTGDPVTASTYYELQSDTTSKYYQENNFWIKSATTSAIEKQLYIDSVSINTASNSSADLDKAVRVLVKVGSFTKIFCLNGGTTSYKVANQTTVTAVPVDDPAAKNVQVEGQTTIPASTSDPINAKVYVYFEGEDAKCISNNVTATLDQLTVSVSFKTAE